MPGQVVSPKQTDQRDLLKKTCLGDLYPETGYDALAVCS